MHIKLYHILIFILVFQIRETKRLSNKQKKYINIAFPVNNKYINFLYISLISLLENSDKNTVYNIYIQVGEMFDKNNMQQLYDIEKHYFNCFINIINMHSDFNGVIQGRLDTCAYYRLKLPVLLPNLNRIIHIDSDTLILKDLMELYTLNFNGKYILGRLDILVNELDFLGIQTNTYINTGILLFDLYNLRKNNYVDKFMNYIKEHNNVEYLYHHDQTLINYICYDKIGVLRPKYHMWPFKDKKDVIEKNKIFRIPYNEDEFISDFYDPFIVHFVGEDKVDIFFKWGKFYDKYYSYSKIAEQKMKDVKFHVFSNDISNIKLPPKFTFPFCYTPHELCILAKNEVMSFLSTRYDWQKSLSEGKMFGVLVVKNNKDEIGFLASFSGIFNGTNNIEYFVPPIYDLLTPNGFFKTGEKKLLEFSKEIKSTLFFFVP